MIALFSIIRAGQQSPPGSGYGSERRDAIVPYYKGWGRGQLIGSLLIHFSISVHLPPTIYRRLVKLLNLNLRLELGLPLLLSSLVPLL